MCLTYKLRVILNEMGLVDPEIHTPGPLSPSPATGEGSDQRALVPGYSLSVSVQWSSPVAK